MKTEVKKIDSNVRELNVEINGDIIKSKFEEVFKRIGQDAKVPGFRPGHAPQGAYIRHSAQRAPCSSTKLRTAPFTPLRVESRRCSRHQSSKKKKHACQQDGVSFASQFLRDQTGDSKNACATNRRSKVNR